MNETPDDQALSSEVVRAEELVDSWTSALSTQTARWSHELLKGVALAREGLEDIWAEAQARSREQLG
ncbi:MAG: hypothetical protein M3Z66_08630 [Chloroflexota bacterium]|nr:hypothetical protein [Chloroflexota bacterium]